MKDKAVLIITGVFFVGGVALIFLVMSTLVPIKVQYVFPERNDEIVIDSALSIAVNTIGMNRACPQQVGIYIADYDPEYDPNYPWSVWLMDTEDRPNDGYPMYFKTLEEVKAHLKLVLFYDLTEGI